MQAITCNVILGFSAGGARAERCGPSCKAFFRDGGHGYGNRAVVRTGARADGQGTACSSVALFVSSPVECACRPDYMAIQRHRVRMRRPSGLRCPHRPAGASRPHGHGDGFHNNSFSPSDDALSGARGDQAGEGVQKSRLAAPAQPEPLSYLPVKLAAMKLPVSVKNI